MRSIYWAVVLSAVLGLSSSSCSLESERTIRRKLDIILTDDLKSVIDETPKESLSDSVCYVVREYETFGESKYRAKAVVDFLLFDKVDVKMVRKYRYHRDLLLWERYFNEYQFKP